MEKISILNLGCGNKINMECVNIDFVSNNKNVIQYNLSKGIPFPDNTFDVVYHSQVLEHFNRFDGAKLIKECHRVLKLNGILRVVVPDLEEIAREYINLLEKNINNPNKLNLDNYNWIIIELFDQISRNSSGGEFLEYLFKENVPNEKYVFDRIGYVAKNIRDIFKTNKKENLSLIKRIERNLNYDSIRRRLLNFILTKREKEFLKIGEFRLSGENHYFMYDQFSLSNLLIDSGFRKVEKKTPLTSIIENWGYYELDIKNNQIFDPKSLFMEAIK